jgi:hypothetical protein
MCRTFAENSGTTRPIIMGCLHFCNIVHAHHAAAETKSRPCSLVQDLQDLHELHKAGVLNDQEFSLAKAKVLAPQEARTPTNAAEFTKLSAMASSAQDEVEMAMCAAVAIPDGHDTNEAEKDIILLSEECK